MFIRHITLTSGHSRDSQPGEMPRSVRAALAPLIERMAAGEVAEAIPVPGMPGYSITGRASKHCLVAVVWRDRPARALASIGVAARSRCGAPIWRALHTWGEVPVVTDPAQCPAAPWVAVALDTLDPDEPALGWLGDFERCLAWAFVDPQGGV